jgi:type VI secretion system secreted protein Hcp
MSDQIYLSIESASHGQIEGSVTRAGFEGLIEIIATQHEVSSNLGGTGRRATGRNKHESFVITKGIDKASVKLLDVWNSHERLESFRLTCYRPSDDGTSTLFYAIELQEAMIVSIEQQLANASLTTLPDQELIAFTYRGITWEFPEDNLTTNSSPHTRF